NVPVFCCDRGMIFEDQMRMVLMRLGEFRPTVVLATLSAISFEVLRYLPPGVFRAGVGQADHSLVYEMMRHYTPDMDLAAMVSQAMKAKAEAIKDFARSRVAALPYGVPMPDKAPGRPAAGPLRILYLGRLDRVQKRAHLFPQIFEQLKASGISFHWTMAGEGPERANLERLMASTANQRVEFTGAVPYSDIGAVLQSHDIYLLASDFEGLPLSLLEAMGHGLVPVVSDLESGIREVVDATNGMLVPVDDIAGYARAIIHLHGHRDELASKSAAARERVRREFSVTAMTERWLSLFPKTIPVIEWPERWKIKPPLVVGHSLRFSPPIRVLRRLAKRFRT
ncbi:MAG: glycosyltransferase family 4 protein, partial [Verrucomicrobia bacterium]|nr:glycosyltransferase family 4 protein [Verrucomicrobiota bacterium]